MVHPTRFIKSLLVFSLLTYSARAEESLIPINFTGHYDFALGGISFGKLNIAFTHNATSYKATADVSTVGIAQVFVQHASHSTSSGSGKNFHYDNVQYESRYETKKKPRYVKWEKKANLFTLERVEPPDSRSVRPAVPQNLKQAAYDPVALAIAARSMLAKSLQKKQNNFVMDVYDGRRLTRITFTINDERIIKLAGVDRPAYRLTARRKAIAGFTQKEQSRIDPNEPPVTIYFSHDEKLVPIRLELPLMFGVATATLRL